MNIQCVNCQNNKHVNLTTNRLVTESCGHVKCMECLLSETSGCQACAGVKTSGNHNLILDTEKAMEADSEQYHQTDLEDHVTGLTTLVVEDSSVKHPEIEHSYVKDPVVAYSSVEDPVVQYSSVKDPAVEDSSIKGPVDEDCSVKGLVVVYSSVEDPGVENSTVEDLVVEESTVDEPVADEIVTIEIVQESICSRSLDIPKDTENSEEQDWITKKMFKPDLPHIRMDKDSAGATTYYCLKCKKQFRARSHVSYHAYCNGAKKPYQCTECNKEFTTATHYQYHVRAHSDDRPFSCDVCGAAFRHMSKLLRHKLLHSDKQYSCKQCSKSFSTPTALRRHGLLHSGERPHQCPVCERRFRDHSNYRKHLQRHGDDRKCMCGGCGAGSVSRPRAHRCPRCGHAFHSGKDMRRHMHVHTDSKPFRCRVCDRRFRRKDNLSRHIRNRHPAHSAASAAHCDLAALKERANVTTTAAEVTKVPKDASDKTQLEKMNPLPPIPKDVIQSMCDDSKQQSMDTKEPVIDKSYILEANNARQSVIVAKFTTDKPYRDSSPETAYVHKIKKSMAPNSKDPMLPPIDAKKLFQFYNKTRETENTLDIGVPRPENVQKLKTILMMDDKNVKVGEGEKQAPVPMHWRRKMTLNINW